MIMMRLPGEGTATSDNGLAAHRSRPLPGEVTPPLILIQKFIVFPLKITAKIRNDLNDLKIRNEPSPLWKFSKNSSKFELTSIPKSVREELKNGKFLVRLTESVRL